MNKSMDVQRSTSEPFHRKYRNVFVGLFILIPLIILPGFLLYTFLKTAAQWDHLYVKYENAGGLARNAAVTILGMNVGYVEKVSLNDAGYIDVELKINRRNLKLVKKDTKARLQQKNVAFGDWEIELATGSHNSPGVKSGDTLASLVQAPIAKTLEQINKTVETFQSILQTIADGKGSIGRIIKQDTLVNILQATGRSAGSLVVRAHTTLERVDSVLIKVAQIGDKGKVLADSVVGIASKVGKLVTDINLLVNSVQTSAKDIPAVMESVKADLADVELMLKTLQNNALIKNGVSTQQDPLLNDNSLR